MLWKCDISRKIAPEYDLFCIIWKNDVPYFPKYGIFFLEGKWKISCQIQPSRVVFRGVLQCQLKKLVVH